MGLDTILLAVGNTDDKRVPNLVSATVDIAEPANATVELAHVFSESEYEQAKNDLRFGDERDVTPTEVAKRHATVRDIRDELSAAGLRYDVHGSYSKETSKADRIVELATDVDADFLVVGGRTRSPAGKAVFGSTAQEVMMHAPCPVVFVRSD